MAALSYHVYKLYPYSERVAPAAVSRAECREGEALRSMVANVKRRNEDADVFLDQVAATDPDLLLIMETDAWWDQRLATLGGRYPHHLQSIPDDHAFFGMHLFSKLELIEPEFRFFFDADTPTPSHASSCRTGRYWGLWAFIRDRPSPGLSQPRCGMRTYFRQP
ncbi:endonuclease/exonuclease/phosphatase family protein [Rhizobium halophilum]|uniref:endonuclease/exonuclease/phosphatase family protein n=1 Tax=Rhizobium halophilum TaxID=2846852 RepID=UPI001EFD945A|nr:endonuclease/exonuclease/phosphatase family protein [Rhizobium halophilum]MCF6369892.1 endonuclease/exonuclease/phosphatase family protein [Rhizobium halophilum]